MRQTVAGSPDASTMAAAVLVKEAERAIAKANPSNPWPWEKCRVGRHN